MPDAQGWWRASDGRWYPPEAAPTGEGSPDPGPPPVAVAPTESALADENGPLPPPAGPRTPVLAPPPPPPRTNRFGSVTGGTTTTLPGSVAPPPEPAGTAGPGVGAPAPEVPVPVSPVVAGLSTDPVRTGWSPRNPSLVYSAAEMAELEGTRTGRPDPTDRRGSGNVVWCLITMVLAGATLYCTSRIWYTMTASHPWNHTLNPALLEPRRLLAHGYGGWRIVVPVLAGAVTVLAPIGALVWTRRRYPRPFVYTVRILAGFLIAAVITTLVVRVSTFGPTLTAERALALQKGAVIGYKPAVAAYAALAGALLTFASSLGIATKVR